MPRRRAEKPIFDEIAAEFENIPLPVGVVTAAFLAVTGWLLPIIFPMQGLNLAGSLATIGRYLVWLLALMIMLSSLYGATRRLFDRRRFDSDLDLGQLNWSQFEGYLAEYFRRRGSSVTYRGGSSADGGVDLVLEDATGRRIVQAKHWKTRRVGVLPLRALWGVRDDERAQGAVFVTSGEYTPDALAFAQGKQLELVSGARLREMIVEVKGVRPDGPERKVPAAEECPQCHRGVLERKLARRGVNAGSYFVGCSRYPQCRYARDA